MQDEGGAIIDQPTFSIITIVYNGQRFIHRSHHCLLAQTFTDWEWIVVDDGSRDDTASLLKDLSLREPRLRVVSYQTNRGRGFARTVALEHARGRWAVIWDVDDLYFPARLQRIEQARKENNDYYTSTALVLDQKLRFIGMRDWSEPFPPLPVRTGCHAAMAVRLDLARQVGYFPTLRTVGQIGEDVAMVYTLAAVHRGYFDDTPMLINVIGNEVFLRKSIHSNEVRTRHFQDMFEAALLPMSRDQFDGLIRSARKKLRILKLLQLCPLLYPLVMSFRPRGKLVPERTLTPAEELFIQEIRDRFGQWDAQSGRATAEARSSVFDGSAAIPDQ